MNIALIGHGKMGKEIERLAQERGIGIAVRLTSKSEMPAAYIVKKIDIALHFAVPTTVLEHIKGWAQQKKNLVIGTTGWMNDLEKARSIVQQEGTALVYAPNFSVGVNLFSLIVKQAGMALNKFPEYDVSINETHHNQKLDSPSGTALTLATTLISVLDRKKEILSKRPEGAIRPEQLHVSSTRLGTVVGTHRVTFDSAAEQIELIHSAKNRSGFALGALLAAEWVRDKKGIFTMEDVLADLLK